MNRFFRRISITILTFSLFISLHAHCMLNNIAGTDTILHDDYKYLSLVHGAIAWETGVIRRLYDFGQIFPDYKEDKQGRKLIENYENPDQTDPIGSFHSCPFLSCSWFYRRSRFWCDHSTCIRRSE